VVDRYEPSGAVLRALEKRGVTCRVTSLRAGDYDLGHGVLVERKTTADFHHSLQRGRLWGQVGKLRTSAALPYVLIEGTSLAGPIGADAVRGACLAILGQGVALIRARDPIDSAAWLHLLATRMSGRRLGRDRPVYAQRLKPGVDEVPEAMLAAVPGISTVTARALLRRFGTVRAVILAGEEAWSTVEGVGPVRARALSRAIS
jgi:Fanconi anemia group M protein